jgi:hypothetical protein
LEVTVIDHALSRPWSVLKSYRHGSDPQPLWLESVCGEGNNHVQIGKENYMISGDGLLMPTKRGPGFEIFQAIEQLIYCVRSVS